MNATSQAVLFDLDGVISDTASVHARAWATVFNNALKARNLADRPFDEERDYLLHVDGKTRQAGIEGFLASRDIVLPLGDADAEGLDTVNGIGNVKNAVFRDLVARSGVTIFDDARRLIAKLRAAGFALGLASSSKNARMILETAGMIDNFSMIMDGLVAERDGVRSKPSPDFYRHAAMRFERKPADCVVVEDAISGIVSASQAGVGLIIGVARRDNVAALLASGADLVVVSLDELTIDALRRTAVPPSRTATR